MPFEIPDFWCWCRLGNICIILDNQRIPISLSERKKRTVGKLQEQLFLYYGATGVAGYIDEYLFDGKYVLLGEDGAPFLEASAQKAYIASGKFWVNNHAHVLQSLILEDYLLFCLNSLNYSGYVHGTTRLKLTNSDMCKILIPVPPQKEQHIVSEYVNSVLSFLKSIEASLI